MPGLYLLNAVTTRPLLSFQDKATKNPLLDVQEVERSGSAPVWTRPDHPWASVLVTKVSTTSPARQTRMSP